MSKTYGHLRGAMVRTQFVRPRNRKFMREEAVLRADIRLAVMHAWESANAGHVIQNAELRAKECTVRWQAEVASWPPGLAQAMGEEDLAKLAEEWLLSWNTQYALTDQPGGTWLAGEG